MLLYQVKLQDFIAVLNSLIYENSSLLTIDHLIAAFTAAVGLYSIFTRVARGWFSQWVTLFFSKTKVLNSSFKPKLNLDTKIQFQTNAEFDFGFKPSFKLGLKPS